MYSPHTFKLPSQTHVVLLQSKVIDVWITPINSYGAVVWSCLDVGRTLGNLTLAVT